MEILCHRCTGGKVYVSRRQKISQSRSFGRWDSGAVFGQQGGQLGHRLAAGDLLGAVDDGQGDPVQLQGLHQMGIEVGVDHVGGDQLIFPGDALGVDDQLAAVLTA